MKIQVGNPVPISVQLEDGQTGQKVIANVYDFFSKQLSSLTLAEGVRGFYFSNEFLMPDLEGVVVQTFVDGKTLEGEPYAVGAATFYSTPKPVKEKIFTGILTHKVKLEKIFEGVLIETKIAE